MVLRLIRRFKSLILFICLAYFSYLMVLITLQYIPVNIHVAFLRLKVEQIKWTPYNIAFFIHVYTSIIVLLLGFIQFSQRIRCGYPALHKNTGKLYILLVVLLAGPSGLLMGYYANGGPVAQTSFCLLAILWMYFTGKAYQKAREKDFKAHRNYMYRSYALTLSAISLRLFKWGIVAVFQSPPMDTYRLVAWLGWVVNLLICEIITYRLATQNLRSPKSS